MDFRLLLTFAKRMEHMLFFWYNTHKTRKEAYETTRNTPAAPTAPTSGDPTLEARKEVFVLSRSLVGSIQEFGLPMVSIVSKEGSISSSAEAHSRTPSETLRYPKEKAESDSFKGSFSLRLSDRSLDFKAYRRTDKQAFLYRLSSQPRLEGLERDGMELPEAPASCPPKERRRNRSLEALPLAAYKKTPKELAPTSYFLMKVVFCLFPILPAPGHQKDKRLSFTTFINKTGFLPSVPFRYRQLRNVSPFILSAEQRTLRVWIYKPFLKSLPDILKELWLFSGIAGLSTGEQKSKNGSLNIQGSIQNSFRLTHLNLILRNMCGIKLTTHYPTALYKIYRNLKADLRHRLPRYAAPRSFFGLASMHLICRGQDRTCIVPLLMRNSIL